MAGYVLGPTEIMFVLRHAGKNKRSLKYRRKFAGLSVGEAIARLNYGSIEPGVRLPKARHAKAPIRLNGRRVKEENLLRVFLLRGDVLSAEG